MNSKELMISAMHGNAVPRSPVMCQLALGHIYKNTDIGPFDFWYTAEGIASGFIEMSDRYKFDGILVSTTGIGNGNDLRQQIVSIRKRGDGYVIQWKQGRETYIPSDDYPYDMNSIKTNLPELGIDQIDLGRIRAELEQPLPTYYLDVLTICMNKRGQKLSIHGEVGTVFEKYLLLFGSWEAGLLTLIDDPEKAVEIMSEMNLKVIKEALAQSEAGIDALKLSSPFAGQGFISREFYEKYVLRFEREVIKEVHSSYDVPCYLHTCGRIGDRLDLMLQSGIDGIECLDPPPLGNVDLEDAVKQIGQQIFIKGNLDSVNELIQERSKVKEIAKKRLEIGKKSKGYILSSACSVSPNVPPENVEVLHEVACEI